MFNVETVVDPSLLQQIPTSHIDQQEQDRQDRVATLKEVMTAIDQMKNGQAPGKDDGAAELLKVGGFPLAQWLHQITHDVCIEEVMIEDWMSAILLRLFEKGDKYLCDN